MISHQIRKIDKNKGKMCGELHNLKNYIKQGKSKRNLQIKSSEPFKINNIWEVQKCKEES